jgi:hypothetical protein
LPGLGDYVSLLRSQVAKMLVREYRNHGNLRERSVIIDAENIVKNTDISLTEFLLGLAKLELEGVIEAGIEEKTLEIIKAAAHALALLDTGYIFDELEEKEYEDLGNSIWRIIGLGEAAPLLTMGQEAAAYKGFEEKFLAAFRAIGFAKRARITVCRKLEVMSSTLQETKDIYLVIAFKNELTNIAEKLEKYVKSTIYSEILSLPVEGGWEELLSKALRETHTSIRELLELAGAIRRLAEESGGSASLLSGIYDILDKYCGMQETQGVA